MEDKPPRSRRGVYRLSGGPEGDPRLNESVVGVHDDEQLAPQPVELVDEHRVELARLRVL
jgi:hypothetical protein